MLTLCPRKPPLKRNEAVSTQGLYVKIYGTFVITKIRKSIGDWINELWHTPAVEYCSAIKRAQLEQQLR